MNSPHSPGKFILNTLPRQTMASGYACYLPIYQAKNQQRPAVTVWKWKQDSWHGRRDPECTDALKGEMCSRSIHRAYCSDKTKAESRVSASVFNLYVFTDEMIFPLAGLMETLCIFMLLYLRNALYANVLFNECEYEIMNMKCVFIIN